MTATKPHIQTEDAFFDEVRRAVADRTAGRRTKPFVSKTFQPADMLDLHDPLTLQALLEVVEALQGVPVGAKLQFFLGPKGSLGGLTPLQALEQPALRAKVLDVARAFAES